MSVEALLDKQGRPRLFKSLTCLENYLDYFYTSRVTSYIDHEHHIATFKSSRANSFRFVVHKT